MGWWRAGGASLPDAFQIIATAADPRIGLTETGDGAYRVRLSGGPDLRFVVASATPLDGRDDRRFWCPVYGEKACARWVRSSSPSPKPATGAPAPAR